MNENSAVAELAAECPEIKTIKAAKQAGFHPPKPDEYGGERITVKGRLLVRNAKQSVSATEWRRRGYKVLPGQTPHATMSGRVGYNGYGCGKPMDWAVYRDDQVAPIRKRESRSAVVIPILRALWTINRRAKRCRDLASRNYNCDNHGFAGNYSREKTRLYHLKSRAMHYLLESGLLSITGHHCFGNRLWAEVCKGAGYTFHRPCPPQHSDDSEQCQAIEAKSKEATEARLVDAIYTINSYLAGSSKASVYQWPARVPTHT